MNPVEPSKFEDISTERKQVIVNSVVSDLGSFIKRNGIGITLQILPDYFADSFWYIDFVDPTKSLLEWEYMRYISERQFNILIYTHPCSGRIKTCYCVRQITFKD